MLYTIYKTTNLINGKYYIGKHQTQNLDDGYIGSGKRLKYAIKKYGVENFVTNILFVFDEEWKMNLAEKILVVPDVETNYNLCPGGKGGFGYINESGIGNTSKGGKTTSQRYKSELKEWRSKGAKTKNSRYPNKVCPCTFEGMKHTEETKQKMRKPKNVGKSNPQYGTCWMTDGAVNIKIKLEAIDKHMEMGFYRGRV